ncbi:MAG: pilus assembly FimT family protein [Pyrinomonadaceae bacterium]
MKHSALSGQRGISLIEVMIVLVIVGIMVTLAVINFRGATVDLQRQGIVREFKVYLERARFDSVKRRAVTEAEMAKVTLNSSTSFTATLDFDNNGVIDPVAETRVVNFNTRSQTRILVSDTLNYPITLEFNQRGHVIAKDSTNADITPLFTICSNCSSQTPDQTVLAISDTGTVAVLRNGQLPSTLPTPTVTAQTPTLNCYVLVVTNSGCVLN